MKKSTIFLLFSFSLLTINSQVLNTSNSEVQQALGSSNFEMSPLANFFQKRTPMMDILFNQVRDDDGIVTHYVGAEIGSAYEDKTFLPGKVYYNEEELGKVYYRFNAYNNEIEVKKTLLEEEKRLALIKNTEVKLVTINNEIVYRKFIDKKGNPFEGYLTLLETGKVYTLYRRLFIKFTEAKAAENSMVNPTPSKFTNYTEYYIQKNEEKTIKELPLNKKKLSKLFSKAEASKIQAYFKKNKPDVNNENTIRNLFLYIDLLQ
jgi:hypothetical protein